MAHAAGGHPGPERETRVFAAPVTLAGQQEGPSRSPGGRALNLGIGGYGISFGNSRRRNGIRLNAVDRAVERINGLNVGNNEGVARWLPIVKANLN